MVFSKDSTATSWVEGADGSGSPIQNLPYGVFSHGGSSPRVCAKIGFFAVDLSVLHDEGLFADTLVAEENVFARDALNDFMAMGQDAWRSVRRRLVSLLLADSATDSCDDVVAPDRALRDNADLQAKAMVSIGRSKMHMPTRVGNFVDFYSSKEHATNIGSMFRDPSNPLLPNWVHIPIGYNGRSSSVVVSGTDIVRPCGQTKADDADAPSFGPCRLLDIELEMGFYTGPANELGAPIPASKVADNVFGMGIVNDWSARDIQKWEYVPLGPFLGKSFATSVSPWVVPLDALEPFRVPQPVQEPDVLPYLRVDGDWGLDIDLQVELSSAKMEEEMTICRTNFKYMYWTIMQQLVHQTSNGTNVAPGDLYGSGTVSGPTPDSYGSLMEICWKGTKPLKLPTGEERKFLADGDTVRMSGVCNAPNFKIGFGEVSGTILPAHAS
ncbi:MAG: fumarylacetoacetase [Phycisphaerae bacterium]|nr:MAG: fumarylacetoacetase [Phycisphaerae bacterium]